MIRLKVSLLEYGSSFSKEIVLPCDLYNELKSFGGSEQVVHFDFCYGLNAIGFKYQIGSADKIIALNRLLDEFNTECPDMTIEYLEALMSVTGIHDIFDSELYRKIVENDYMMDYVHPSIVSYFKDDDEKCAYYLAKILRIPFAKNIIIRQLENMAGTYKEMVDWKEVWSYYEQMGFNVVRVRDELFILHWGNAI